MPALLWWFAFFTCQRSQACEVLEAEPSHECRDVDQSVDSESISGGKLRSTSRPGTPRLEAVRGGAAGSSLLQLKSWPARPTFTPFDDSAEDDAGALDLHNAQKWPHDRVTNSSVQVVQNPPGRRSDLLEVTVAQSLQPPFHTPPPEPVFKQASAEAVVSTARVVPFSLSHPLAFFFQGARGHVATRAIGFYLVLTIATFICLLGCMCCFIPLLKQQQQKDSRHRGGSRSSRRHHSSGGNPSNLHLRAQHSSGVLPGDHGRTKRSPMFTAPMSGAGGSASSSEAPATASKGLCPGLVVPESSECVLCVEILRESFIASAGHSTKRLDILDLNGHVVLQAQVVRPWPSKQSLSQALPIAMLRTTRLPEPPQTATGWSVEPGADPGRLSICRAGSDYGLHPCVYIRDKDDVSFVTIRRDPAKPRYILTNSRGDLRLFFEGSFSEHTVSVLNDRRDLLSQTEPTTIPSRPSSSFYTVRITAGVDVGLILSGLLSLDALEEVVARG